MSGDRTVTVHTLDHGPVTLPEPSWCAGHDGQPEVRADLHHTAPLDVPAGLVGLAAELVEFPYGEHPVPVSVYIELTGVGTTLDPRGLREYAAALNDRAAVLRRLADRLTVLRSGGAW
ncbi:DUF6907 domain-containing protein [Streptomyces sp. NPDC127051]|uniref:DUF6907 domain-containing protein n=1 Tax=Streptomyces sp. NPDC127051 TaxID=3347119 RepID=UPI0036463B3A